MVYQQAPDKPYKEPTITEKGQRLQVVDKFTYLGSTLSRVVHIDDEVNARANAAFGRLRGSVWDRSGIRLDVCSICACLDLSVSSSSWGLGRAAVCDCGTPWTFLLPFLTQS